ncbi:hypothetical protein HPG69_012070 [Diceros bicornis minor]|uniref:FHA domain-containing protein n=1 Tax=Diceros bicornis minor TaxID=77932 RepID=A0A7J7EXT7_DICBM|nr:hypothetical protein HPG69_012070 [Diceros bicornis minor]
MPTCGTSVDKFNNAFLFELAVKPSHDPGWKSSHKTTKSTQTQDSSFQEQIMKISKKNGPWDFKSEKPCIYEDRLEKKQEKKESVQFTTEGAVKRSLMNRTPVPRCQKHGAHQEFQGNTKELLTHDDPDMNAISDPTYYQKTAEAGRLFQGERLGSGIPAGDVQTQLTQAAFMWKIRRCCHRAPSDGWEISEAALRKLDQKMRQVELESLEGKRQVESLWPIFKVHHQKSWNVFQLLFKRKAIKKEVYAYCLREGCEDLYLIANSEEEGCDHDNLYMVGSWVMAPQSLISGKKGGIPIAEALGLADLVHSRPATALGPELASTHLALCLWLPQFHTSRSQKLNGAFWRGKHPSCDLQQRKRGGGTDGNAQEETQNDDDPENKMEFKIDWGQKVFHMLFRRQAFDWNELVLLGRMASMVDMEDFPLRDKRISNFHVLKAISFPKPSVMKIKLEIEKDDPPLFIPVGHGPPCADGAELPPPEYQPQDWTIPVPSEVLLLDTLTCDLHGESSVPNLQQQWSTSPDYNPYLELKENQNLDPNST